MPQASNGNQKCRKSQTQHNLASFSEPKANSSSMVSNHNHASESRNTFSKNPKKKKKFMIVKLKGLGCKGASSPASTPAIIRQAAEWEAKQTRQENQRRKGSSHGQRNAGNVVVDVPDLCCTPPGIGIASDFAPRNRNTAAPRIDHRKYSREARRNGDAAAATVGSRTNHRSAGEIIEMLMAQQTPLSERITQERDRYQHWRLNVDDMSYEELLDLSDKIGYVGTGLEMEEISSCVRKFKHFDPTWFVTGQKDWKCSICQDKCRRDDEVGRLDCGHYHHVRCIKQWLLYSHHVRPAAQPASSKFLILALVLLQPVNVISI